MPPSPGLSEKERKELKENYKNNISFEFDELQTSYAELVKLYGLIMKSLGNGSITISQGYTFTSNLENAIYELDTSLDKIQPVKNMTEEQIDLLHEIKSDYGDAFISWRVISGDMKKMLDKGDFSNKKFEDIKIQLDNATACSVSAIQNKKKLDASIASIE